ncbi:aldose 1-epimerase [Ectopseudomonas guguanensis]|uniref:Aldose 1-epimerase n=1 Tax=Ectopseudomonas guguanensis TaxID=1198456 RepID=A0A1H0XGD4_9GAMM|nr:aldose 1-epimerase [Pseudomonas guguanensis]SDQ01992.1 aldose 1-epimerase [Pseudomonas guguanensis]
MPTTLLTLRDSLTQLTLAPELGASLVNWVRLSDGRALLRHSDEQALDAANPRRLACYPLLPWSNRIGGGGFATPAGWQSLSANTDHEPLPIHGSAWQQPWQVVDVTSDSASLQLDSQVPFPYRATLQVGLANGCLRLSLHATHLGQQPTWYGLGLHPYLPRTTHTRVQAKADGVWLCGEDKLSSHWVELPEAWNFAEPRLLPQQLVDNAFSHWPGDARIIQTDAGYQLVCHAHGADVFLLFCPQGQNFFCFEPVTHPVNAHHLPQRPGLQLLAPGQTCRLHFSLQYQALAG